MGSAFGWSALQLRLDNHYLAICHFIASRKCDIIYRIGQNVPTLHLLLHKLSTHCIFIVICISCNFIRLQFLSSMRCCIVGLHRFLSKKKKLKKSFKTVQKDVAESRIIKLLHVSSCRCIRRN